MLPQIFRSPWAIRSLALATAVLSPSAWSQNSDALKQALSLHASFNQRLDADFSRGDKACTVRESQGVVPAVPNEAVRIAPGAGRFGGAMQFVKKSNFRPQFAGAGVLNYNDQNWSATVSIWLRLDPDKDLEPGYCDPVQIIGDDSKKGFIFLEWSKDELPRLFRFAIRPLVHIWNPDNVPWADIPFDKRPMVQVTRAPFSRESWTHVVFSFENLNDKARKPIGRMHLNGRLQGTIKDWDLTFGWKPESVMLVLGAAYVGFMDDLAVFNRALTDAEVQHLFALPNGVAGLHP